MGSYSSNDSIAVAFLLFFQGGLGVGEHRGERYQQSVFPFSKDRQTNAVVVRNRL